jgi:hypothetical protein
MFWNGSTTSDGFSGRVKPRPFIPCPRRFVAEANGKGAHRSGNVFQVLLADIDEFNIDFAPHLTYGVLRDANAAGLGDAFEPRSDVDAVAVDVLRFDDHVTDVDAHPENDAPVPRHFRVAVGHCALNFDSASHRVDNAGKLRQHSIPGILHDTTAVSAERWIYQLGEMGPQTFVCALLVLLHQPRIGCNINR